jgi:outer membrane protein OmpA-like peptidoglycan-associated protein
MTFLTRPGILALKAQASCKSGLLAATMLVSSLAACSSVPDAVNPIEWYKGTRDFVTGTDDEKAKDKPAAAKTAARTEAAGDFPSLSSVPDRPAVTPENQRALAAKGLAADSARASYSDEEIRRDTGSASARPAGVSSQVTSVPASAGTPVAASPVPQRPASVQPSGQPVSAQSVFQQRLAEQSASKLTPEMMMQGFFTGEAPPPPGAKTALSAPGSAPKSQILGQGAAATVPFELGSDLIAPAAQAQLRQLAQNAVAQGKRLKIVGHSSGRTSDVAAAGGDISQARANAVARAIVGLGVSPGAVSVMALSDTQPVSNVEAANRRVEIFFE